MWPYIVQIKTRYSEKPFNHTIHETWDCESFKDAENILKTVFNIPPFIGMNDDDNAELSEDDVEKYAVILRNIGLDEYGVKTECDRVKADYPTFCTASDHAKKMFDDMENHNGIYTTRSFSTSDGTSVDICAYIYIMSNAELIKLPLSDDIDPPSHVLQSLEM